MKNQWKNNENQYKFGFEKTTSKTTWKYWVQDPPWLHFGGFGEAPGRHWGTPGRHDRVSWALLGASWAPLWSHGCFGLDLGRVWEALGRFLGSFGEDFEKILGRCWEDIFVSETPALPRQLAWRHNARGSRTPRVLDGIVQVVPCLLVERSSSERASRIPSGSADLGLFFALGGQVGSKLAPRSHFFAFFSQDASKLRFLAFSFGFSLDFGRFGEGFGSVLARFSHDFSQKCDSWKNSVFLRENQ